MPACSVEGITPFLKVATVHRNGAGHMTFASGEGPTPTSWPNLLTHQQVRIFRARLHPGNIRGLSAV